MSSVLDPSEQGAGFSEGGYSSWQAAIIGIKPNAPVNVLATSVSVSPSTLTLNVGESATLSATVLPNNVTNSSVVWTSSNTNVATVSANGVVTAKRAGATTITATTTDGTQLSASCRLTVVQPVTSVTLNKTSTIIFEGESETLIPTVLPSNASNPTLSWTSSNTSVAVVSNAGVVVAKQSGTTTITATTTDGTQLSAACSVTVEKKTFGPAVITAPELTISSVQVGRLIELPLTMTLPEGADFTNIELHFTFPEGLRPIADSDGVYGYEGVDIPFKGRLPVVNYADNFDVEENWPNYDVVGANISLTPVTVNPCQLYTLHVTPESDFTPGDRQMLIYVKYTDSTNNSYTIGSGTSRVPLTTIHFSNALPGDVNGDGRVDINDVNAVVNLILERTTAFAAAADVNGDGIVNVFDLDMIIDYMLAN